jgi:hypothetical protein
VKKLIRIGGVVALTALLSAPAMAALVPFSGTVTYTQVLDSPVASATGNDADTFAFVFAVGADLRITQIDFELGNGNTSSATNRTNYWDISGTAGSNNYRDWGPYLVSVTIGSVATTDSVVDGGTSTADRNGVVTFSNFIAGNTFSLSGDVDRTNSGGVNCNGNGNDPNCGHLDLTGFNNGGGLTFRIYFAPTSADLAINGANSFVFGTSAWTAGSGGALATTSFSGNVDLVAPEPGTMFLVGAGLIAAGLARRRKFAR